VSESQPDSSAPDVLRIDNRSDRVWVFGYLRLAPLILWLGGLVGFIFVVEYFKLHPTVAFPLFWVVLIGPLVLDRSRLLDPVNFVLFGVHGILVQRLAGKRTYPLDQVERIDMVRPEGEDYDEKQRARRFAELTLHFKKRHRARLLATHEDAVRVAAWAAARGVSIAERPG
jgi:hypothetical protein